MRLATAFVLCVAAVSCGGCREPAPSRVAGGFDLSVQAWHGPAIAYSGYRAGQRPGGPWPSREQVAEDLRILERRWRLIRTYGADRHAADVLSVIRDEGLGLRVMLGIWLDREPGAEAKNAAQIAEGIRLANEFDEIVVAVNVGNEVLIGWTAHPVPEARVIGYVRRVRQAVSQPVTVADNYVWWRDEGRALAREVDFVTIHSYPQWERKSIDEALAYTVENVESVQAALPGRTIVIGEAGWATYTEGNLHLPRSGDEPSQIRYHAELTDWARQRGITLFWFSAFDEPWKGTGTEGHWGLFTVERAAKPAMLPLFPERRAAGPTSPAYPEKIAPSGPDIRAVLGGGDVGSIAGGSVNPLGPGLSEAAVVELPGADGGSALRLRFNGGSWGGVYLLLDDADAAGAAAIALRLRLPDRVASLELKVEGPATVEQSVELLDHETGRDADGWRRFRVPFDELDRIDRTRLAVLGLWNPSDASGEPVAAELALDDLRFD